jgi:hypothetical protein
MSDHIESEQVIELTDVPEPEQNAPCPHVISDADRVALAYIISHGAHFGFRKVLTLGPAAEDIAVIHFRLPVVYSFRPLPVDYRIGSSVLELLDSELIKNERERGGQPLRHIRFAFRNATFDCLCEGYHFTVYDGAMSDVLSHLAGNLE